MFVPNFAPKSVPEFPPFLGNGELRKFVPKSPRFFKCKIPRQIDRRNSGEQAKLLWWSVRLLLPALKPSSEPRDGQIMKTLTWCLLRHPARRTLRQSGYSAGHHECVVECRLDISTLRLGDKIQGPSWGRQKRRNYPFFAPSGRTIWGQPKVA